MLAELLGEEGYEVERRVVPDERDAIAAAIAELARGRCGRADDRRHRARTARRHAGGDRRRARAAGAGDRGGDPRRLAARRRRTPCSRAALAGVRGQTLVVNLPGSPGGCRDGFAVLRPALEARARAARRRADGAPPDMTAALAYPRPLRVARQVRAHDLRAAVRLRRRVPRRGRRAERARPGLDHGRDGRCPLARDGAEPADRRRHRRAQPAHGRPRAAVRALLSPGRWSPSAPASLAVFLSPSSSSTRSCAGSGRSRSRASSIYPYLKRWTWLCHFWLGAVDGLAPIGAWAAITGTIPWEAWVLGGGGRALGGRLRLLLRAARPRGRSRAGAALGRDPLRRAGRLRRRARSATSATVALLVAAGLGLSVGACTGSASPWSPALLAYEHSLVRPGDLRRLDTAFFTMNGVISRRLLRLRAADVL